MSSIKERNKEYKDVGSILAEDRIINLVGEVTDEMAYNISSELMIIDNMEEEAGKPISLYINSPGGSVNAGFAIIDTMNSLKSPVYTICIGLAASMGATILSSGFKGKRVAYPNSTILVHQMSTNNGDRFVNIQDSNIDNEYNNKLNNRLCALIAYNCGVITLEEKTLYEKYNSQQLDKGLKKDKIYRIINKKIDDFKNIFSRDYSMFPEDAKKFGIIDIVAYPEPKIIKTEE